MSAQELKSQTRPQPHHQCPVCGGENHCGPAKAGHFDVECWCRSATMDPGVLASIPEAKRGQHCLCPRCASGVGLDKGGDS